MTVFLDVLIIENLIVNFFLLNITAATVKVKVKLRYIFGGASIGCVYFVLMFCPLGKYLVNIPVKLIIAVVMTLAVFRKKNFLFIIKSSSIFILYSMVLAGLCFFIQLRENGFMSYEIVIINFTYKKLLLSIMIIYMSIERVVVYVKERKGVQKLIFNIDIMFKDSQKSLKAFLDTGNELREPVTNLPVILVEKDLLKEFKIPQGERYHIPYNVVNGYNGKLEGFKPDDVKIHKCREEIETIEVIIAFCDNKLSKIGEYNALLSRGIFE